MPFEYLLLDAVIFAPVFAYACARRSFSRRQWFASAAAVLLVAVPFIAWDVAVAGHHWWSDSRFVLGVRVLGLSLEEWLFFIAVPFACLFLWVTGFRHRGRARPSMRRIGVRVGLVLVVAAAGVGWGGPQYSALALLSLGLLVLADCSWGAAVLTHRGALPFAIAVVLLTALFDSFLTGRPVVHYAPSAISGLRLGSIPIEDFGYGLALVGSVVTVFESITRRR